MAIAETEASQLMEKFRPHPLCNYAVLSNQAAVTDDSNVLWLENNPDNIFTSGISVDTSTGNITLPRHGVFLVTYTVRITRTPFDGTSVATAQLQQTSGGIPTNISQPAVTNYTQIDGVTNTVPQTDSQIVGFAIITTDGSLNNVINLRVFLDTNLTVPSTSGTDANAQLTIVQLR